MSAQADPREESRAMAIPGNARPFTSTQPFAVQSRVARTGRAFTLVELLVVITIISILAALLMPALARVMETARQTACMNNLRQCGMFTQEYTDQYAGYFPSGEPPPGSGNDGWFAINHLATNMSGTIPGSYPWGSCVSYCVAGI